MTGGQPHDANGPSVGPSASRSMPKGSWRPHRPGERRPGTNTPSVPSGLPAADLPSPATRSTSPAQSLREVKGVSVLIYEPDLAAPPRSAARRKARAPIPIRPGRVFINQAVCEGCGDLLTRRTASAVPCRSKNRVRQAKKTRHRPVSVLQQGPSPCLTASAPSCRERPKAPASRKGKSRQEDGRVRGQRAAPAAGPLSFRRSPTSLTGRA